MKCEKCNCEPFGVESWFVPRGEGVDRKVLCPDCYREKNPKMGGSLNIIEELEERGYENPEEVLKQLEIGLQQCRDGKGLTTEELKEKLKRFRDEIS